MRILRSPEQAEDALQEALLRAWRSRASCAGRATFRAWLYRIATNACLDEIRRDRGRSEPAVGRSGSSRSTTRSSCRRRATASTEPGPDVLLEAKETLEHAFRTAIELLPPRQRAVLLLCEVLRCPAAETAGLLGTTVAAVNSALQRARATLGGEQPERAGARLPAGARARPNERCWTATSTRCAGTTWPRWSPWPGPTPPGDRRLARSRMQAGDRVRANGDHGGIDRVLARVTQR